MQADADAHAPLGLTTDVVAQVQFILDRGNDHGCRLSPTAGDRCQRGCSPPSTRCWSTASMFAPLARREEPRYTPRPTLPAWKLVTNDPQWARFVEGEPPCSRAMISRPGRQPISTAIPPRAAAGPRAVKAPTGPLVEILHIWHGEVAWEPQDVQAPVAIIRGDWDGSVTDQEARWLFERLARSAERRDIKIGRGSHLRRLEEMRTALWHESIAWRCDQCGAPGRFQYGWVRGGASAAFVVGAVGAGQVTQATSLGGVV
jgi:hypothetical protein